MRELYEFAVGPMAWAAFGVFLIGSVIRLISMYSLARKKDGPFLSYMSWRFGLRSILNWLIPFNAQGWKENPLVCVTTFVFHLGLILVPLFLLGHVVLWDQYWGFSYPTLPEQAADIFTIAVIVACLVFAWRRATNRTLRFVTTGQDWLVLLIAFLPFLTGFLASQHVGPPLVMTTLHVLSGELMLMAIPFTRLSHMIFGLFSRAYMGSEFGGVRHAKDW